MRISFWFLFSVPTKSFKEGSDEERHNFVTGDVVEVAEGDLANLKGTILSIDGNKITIMPKHDDLKVWMLTCCYECCTSTIYVGCFIIDTSIAFSIFGTRFFVAAIHYTSVGHNEPSFSRRLDYYCGLRLLCFYRKCCPLMTSHETNAHSSNCSVVGPKRTKFCNFKNS